MSASNSQDQKWQSPSTAEWVTFAIALLVMSLLIGLILYHWATRSQEPPILSITMTEIRQANEQFYVPFRVTNLGGQTVESVQVIGEFRVGGIVQEQGEQQIDFLSADEEAEGAFIFSRAPAEGDIAVRVASYKVP